MSASCSTRIGLSAQCVVLLFNLNVLTRANTTYKEPKTNLSAGLLNKNDCFTHLDNYSVIQTPGNSLCLKLSG